MCVWHITSAHSSSSQLRLQKNIRFMRISSDLFPFASHEKYGYDLMPFMPLLSEVGKLAKKYGHRLTTHPGQYVQLGSPTEKVLEASIRELKYHCEFMEGMGIGKDGVCIVHVSSVILLMTSIRSTSKITGRWHLWRQEGGVRQTQNKD
jgi:UV DNA damage repair endonuclease